MSQNYFILHGHFYQPPRENPWTGFIDRQESAYPYNDWNTRINTECYAACTRTPVFSNNHVVKIINCFEYLSFNIGPTLLSWMLTADPRTLEKIVEGDKLSKSRNNGHGNAIAQAYSHMIMPLASIKDQYTQIIWGLKDFQRYFQRESEGIWLGETAINNDVAAVLVDCGIKYVVLSPYQASRVITDTGLIDVLGGRVNPSKPYKLHTKNGDLSIFFYYPHLASEISFGDVLKNADNLLSMVNQEFSYNLNPIKLVHTATDGEVYGHHKAYGNRALAKLIYDITLSSTPPFQFTNYGNFLSQYPAQEECELFLGDDEKGSSWSCAHGVGRWAKDCGCHTGGQESWNQKWRTPLRNGLDVLRDRIYQNIEEVANPLLHDVWQARNDYYIPMLDRTQQAYDNFFIAHQKKVLTTQEKQTILKMMESLHYTMLMYTSCGWFFSDISGIETVQDLLYALRAYEFAQEFLPKDTIDQLKNVLSYAQSNIEEHKTGKEILENSWKKYYINTESFIEYICWMIIGNSGKTKVQTNEFIYHILYQDLEKRQFVIELHDAVNQIKTISFMLDKVDNPSSYLLLWREIDGKNVDYKSSIFWNKNQQWKISVLSSLPSFLRIRFIEQNIMFNQHTDSCKDVNNNELFLSAVFDITNLLLPYEKEILGFYFMSRVHEIFEQILLGNTIFDIETLIREMETVKKTLLHQDEMIFYLEPFIRSIEIYLKNTLQQNDSLSLKCFRLFFWALKPYLDSKIMDILRDEVYKFSILSTDKEKTQLWNIEFNNLMQNMDFLVK